MSTLAHEAAERRRALGLSRKAVARRANDAGYKLSDNTVKRIEEGKKVGDHMLDALAVGLDVAVEDVYRWDDKPYRPVRRVTPINDREVMAQLVGNMSAQLDSIKRIVDAMAENLRQRGG